MRPSEKFLFVAFAALCAFGLVMWLIQMRAAGG